MRTMELRFNGTAQSQFPVLNMCVDTFRIGEDAFSLKTVVVTGTASFLVDGHDGVQRRLH